VDRGAVRGRVQLDGNIDEPKRDRAFPERSCHVALQPVNARSYLLFLPFVSRTPAATLAMPSRCRYNQTRPAQAVLTNAHWSRPLARTSSFARLLAGTPPLWRHWGSTVLQQCTKPKVELGFWRRTYGQSTRGPLLPVQRSLSSFRPVTTG